MKNRLLSAFVGAVGLSGIALGFASMDEQALALKDMGKTGEEFASFSCGAYCDGEWKHVKTCWGNQICCGYIYCSTGVSQGTCCNPATQRCNWDGTGRPPAIQCLSNS